MADEVSELKAGHPPAGEHEGTQVDGVFHLEN